MAFDRVIRHYDDEMRDSLITEYYGHSDFFNYGLWSPDTRDQREASANLVDRLLALVAEKRGTVLDVACGMGATTRHLLKYFAASSVVAVNISTRQLSTSREKVPDARFAAMDAANLGFCDELFDTVMCVEAAFHFVTRERFIREAYRVLKPGGNIVLSDIIFGRVVRRNNRTRWVPENFVSSLGDYEDIYLRAGFRDVQIIDVTAQTWKAFHRNLVRWGYGKVRKGELPFWTFARGVVYWQLVGLVTKQYLLVAARKPMAGEPH